MYVGDEGNHKIRKITPDGLVSTLAGSTEGFADGTGVSAKFRYPLEVTLDKSDNIYVVDHANHKIRKITPSGFVSTLAGSFQGFADGTGTSARFDYPKGITIDTKGTIYVADTFNYKIRKITPDGIVSTVAGSTAGYAEGSGGSAQFNRLDGIVIDSENTIYVCDTGNHKIRKITQE